MHETAFDALARHAGSVHDRRAALKALGAAAVVAALAAPRTADAGKSGKQAKKQALKKCKKQVGACNNEWEKACEGNELCLSLAKCCSFLKTCDAAGQIKCITDIL
jgi:hypothetical protein